jgi:hypothetical protein
MSKSPTAIFPSFTMLIFLMIVFVFIVEVSLLIDDSRISRIYRLEAHFDNAETCFMERVVQPVKGFQK